LQNQTQSFLIRRLGDAGIHPKTRFGQNFLVDPNLQELLVRAAQPCPRDVVLEVGTGTGSLTVLLAREAAFVVTAEVDRQLFTLAAEELADLENVEMLQLDVLKNKNTLRAEVLDRVEARLAVDPARRFKVVANLPYNIATPILTNLLARPRPPQSMTVTIQKELADRIVARPGTKDYGALSIWVQSQCHAEIVRIMAPSVFWPRPKVSSAIVQIVFKEKRRAAIDDLPFFHDFVRAMFFHRRKLLRSELLAAFKKRLDKPAVDRIITGLELPPDARAEQLSVGQMRALCHAVREELGSAET
jgi:16S rRNA (adenine1518-N6/adenine1519-N6)-dimethyltransferase